MHDVLAQWSTTGIALVAYAVVGCLHLTQVRTGLRRARPSGAASCSERAGSARDQLAGAALFQAGLLIAMLALIPPLGRWSSEYIWVRAIQDLLLCVAAPILIASGIPSRAQVRPATSWRRASPVVAAVAFNLSFVGWHLPALFDAFQSNAAAQFAEHAVYLGTGFWFWLQIVRPHQGPWQSPLRRLGLLTATLAVWTVVGMVLVFGSNVLYPGYANSLHHSLTVLDDQQLSGGVLWMGMMPFLITAGVILLVAWLNEEESAGPADADALIRKRAWGWTARSGLR